MSWSQLPCIARLRMFMFSGCWLNHNCQGVQGARFSFRYTCQGAYANIPSSTITSAGLPVYQLYSRGASRAAAYPCMTMLEHIILGLKAFCSLPSPTIRACMHGEMPGSCRTHIGTILPEPIAATTSSASRDQQFLCLFVC